MGVPARGGTPRRVPVSGCSRGLGLVIADAFAADGAALSIRARGAAGLVPAVHGGQMHGV